jgi:polysaccharide biosynthesis/export protein
MKLRIISIGLYFLCVSMTTYAQVPTDPVDQGMAGASSTQTSIGPTASQPGPSHTGFYERHPRYKVMRDDVLMLSFPLSPELSQTVTVQPDGYISLGNVGSVYVQGMTVPEVIEAVKQAYSGVLNHPIIDVDLKDFQKPFFVVSGQVGKPGQYDLRYDITVTQAVSVAGGLTPDAKGQAFLFHRVSDDWVEVKKLDIGSILGGKNVNEDIHVQPGDMIVVPTTFIAKFRRYVPYTLGFYMNAATALL